jgi:MYXO-CTERM domain-containing protein
MPSPHLQRGLRAGLAGLALGTGLLPALAATPALPAQLTVIGQSMDARLDNAAGPVAAHQDPLLASVALGGSSAESDYVQGTLKGVAVAAPAGVNFMLASASFGLQAANTSATPIQFQASGIGLDLEASFSRALGSGPAGTVGNTLNAVFSIAILAPDNSTRYSGYGFYQYRYTLDIGATGPQLVPLVMTDGGFTVAASEDDDEARALIEAPALTLLPGETLGLVINVSGSANVINLFGGSGFAATTDFGHTARLSLELPAGTAFVSATPVTWVSVVPEPQTWALWLAGLAGLALRQRRH